MHDQMALKNLITNEMMAYFNILSMCMKIGLWVRASALKLSQKMIRANGKEIDKSNRRDFNQLNSEVVEERALYSDSIKDLETIFYFYEFHDIKFIPRNVQ